VIKSGNENYSTASAINFNKVEYSSSYVKFNDIGSTLHLPNAINITIQDVAVNNKQNEIFKFVAKATSGTAWFNISGLVPGHIYTIVKDSSSKFYTHCKMHRDTSHGLRVREFPYIRRIRLYRLQHPF